MLASNDQMRRSLLTLVAATTAAAALLAACGDGPDKTVATTPTPAAAKGTAAAPSIPADFGPAPKLGGNVTDIFPKHGSKVTAASLAPRGNEPRGVCFTADLTVTKDVALQWFFLAVDGKEVTPTLLWNVNSTATIAIGCHQPKDPLPAGKHTAAVAFQDPSKLNATPIQVVGWAFEVVP